MKKLLMLTFSIWAFSASAGGLKAIVNDVPISDWDVEMHGKLLRVQLPMIYEGMSSGQLKKAALENLIEEILKGQKGKALNLTLTDKEVHCTDHRNNGSTDDFFLL